MSTQRNNPIAKAIRFALIGGAAVAAVTPAFAAEEGEGGEDQRIEVLGSRIKRTDIETAQPVLTITREDIDSSGLTSIGDILQNMSAAGSALNTTFNNGGDGSTRVDLRNLGTNRTLVLVNGRRWVKGGGGGVNGSVDLNSVPVAVVERVEVLKDGASAVYGSDAIAGVVNIITRKDFEGAEARAYYGESEEGDGQQELYSLTLGNSFDRGNVVVSFSRVNQREIGAGDRWFSEVPVYNTGIAFGSSTTPDGRFQFPLTDTSGAAMPCTFVGPSGAPNNQVLLPGNNGFQGCGDTDLVPYVAANHAYNFAPDNYLLTPNERESFYAQVRYSLTDNIELQAEAIYNNRKSDQLLAAMPVTFGPAVGSLQNVTIGANNPFNPFPGRTWTARGIQRRMVETGGRNFIQDVDTTQYSMGLVGSLDIGSGWDWDVNYYRGENETNQITEGLFNSTRLILASSDACLTTTGCVPFNWFGGAGSITQEMLDYTTFIAQDAGADTVEGHSGNITGTLFELPAGPVAIAAGFEFREESAFDQPDALIATGQSTGNIRQPTYGQFESDEYYVELNVPVLGGLPGVELLELNGAFRTSDYSTYGTNETSKFGFKWKIFSDLALRGTWSEGFRAPNIGELFAGQGDSFPQLTDPCNSVGGVTPALPGCAGVPNGYQQANPQIRITVGSNPDLEPELSESQTFGVVYEPSYAEGLFVSLDWYKFEIEDAITTLSPTLIMRNCAETGDPTFCSLIQRNDTGNVTDLLSAGVNVAELEVEGYDVYVRYKFPEMAAGQFQIRWDTAVLDTYDITSPVVGGFETDELAGTNAGDTIYAEIRSNLWLDWSYGDWDASWHIQYIGEVDSPCNGFQGFGLCDSTDADEENNTMDAAIYNNVQVNYNVADWNTRLTVGINNVLDEKPPISTDAFANSVVGADYDVVGPFWYASVTVNF